MPYKDVKKYRIYQMRYRAADYGKAVPTKEEIEALLVNWPVCPDCGRDMNWLARDGRDTVASLQHYRDGSFGIVCMSCNLRHRFMPGDTYRDLPKGHKLCLRCATIKPESDFYPNNSRTGPRKFMAHCKTCSKEKKREWQVKNRELYNEKQRAYVAKRKAEGHKRKRQPYVPKKKTLERGEPADVSASAGPCMVGIALEG